MTFGIGDEMKPTSGIHECLSIENAVFTHYTAMMATTTLNKDFIL